MLRSVLVLLFFSVLSFVFTRHSLSFPVFHFILTPFWSLAFFYWWRETQFKILILGTAIFFSWQFYFAFNNGARHIAELFILCALVSVSLVIVQKIFQIRIRQRLDRVSEKRRELDASRKKYESRQQSLEHLEHQVSSLLNLFEIARELSEAIDFASLADKLSKAVKNELVFDRLMIWIPNKSNPSGEKVFRVLEMNHNGDVKFTDSNCMSSDLLERLDSQRQMVRNESSWYFPAFDKNDLYAVFEIQGAEEKDLAKIEVLSSFLALLVKKISLYETIRELSIVDDLTQVFVRRHFMERLNEEIKRSQRFKIPLSLLMLDIDHFKRYNDEFGHLVGDATLKKVSEILKFNVRRVDLVGRYGGEEFIVVMPETRQQAALDVAERIRSYIARNTFKLYHVEAKVTVSQGIATYDPQNTNISETADPAPIADALIQAADKCLYQAKDDGRNRVMVFKECI